MLQHYIVLYLREIPKNIQDTLFAVLYLEFFIELSEACLFSGLNISNKTANNMELFYLLFTESVQTIFERLLEIKICKTWEFCGPHPEKSCLQGLLRSFDKCHKCLHITQHIFS